MNISGFNNHKSLSEKIAIVIPCRIYSSRLFGKPLQLLEDKPILHVLLDQLRKTKYGKNIVLGISEEPGNEVFIKFAKQNKIKFVTGSEKDVLGRIIKGANLISANTVIRTTSENPFPYWEELDEMVKKHLSGDFDLTFQKGLPIGSALEVIKLKSLIYAHRYGNKSHRGELSTSYIYENPKKFKVNTLVPEKEVQRPEIRLTVDTPEDLIVARKIFNEFKNSNSIPLKKIIKFLDKNPKIKKINQNMKIKYIRYMK